MKAQGFTLVELLVALALLLSLSLGLSGYLSSSVSNWQRSDAVMDVAEHTRLLEQFLRRTIEGQIAVYTSEKSPVVFQGSTRELRFIAPLTERFGTPGLYRIGFNSNNDDVAFEFSPLVALNTTDTDSAPRRSLGPAVTRMNFAYWGRTGADTQARWHESWLQQSRLPELIATTIWLANGRQTTWTFAVPAARQARGQG